MSFQDLDIKLSYVSCGEDNIADAFLVPALMHTRLYRRSVGFFSSSVFGPIIDGIVALSRNNGKIQLIASPQLSAEDMNAIQIGYQKRAEILACAFEHDFVEAIEELDDAALQLLAALIANGTMDLKIAVAAGAGIYHDKLGILEDFDGNTIVFYGSANSTYNGYRNNYEKIRVIKSWTSSGAEGVADECGEFDSLWNGKNPHVMVYDYTESARRNILTVIEHRAACAAAEHAGPITLRDYQQEAINAWVNNGYRGFYVMATGTGKTWTAIYSFLTLLEKNPAVMTVICAPYKHLVRQWFDDVKRAVPDGIIIMVSSENHNWEQQMTQAIVRHRLKNTTKIIIISTITSFHLDRFQRTLNKSKQEKLLIADEAHRFTKRTDELRAQFQYMLGLSATPFGGKDAAKGEELMAFFGGQVYSLPIEAALQKGFLVSYYYHPIFVNATAEEEENFKKRSAQIAGCFRNGVCVDPEGLVLYHRARLRILSMASEKISRMEEILGAVKERDHFIVYCGDGRLYGDNQDEMRHIQFVKRKLSELGFKSSQFTASESMMERMDLVEAFNEGSIDCLAAIRCLDEGINIPSIAGALILSSNDDYREFVQRRGRILRKHGGKKYANIYDVIVLPSGETAKMAEIELRRYYEYARLALNAGELLTQLDSIAADYGLETADFVSAFEEGKEAELDD